MSKVITALEMLQANLPPTLAKSQVRRLAKGIYVCKTTKRLKRSGVECSEAFKEPAFGPAKAPDGCRTFLHQHDNPADRPRSQQGRGYEGNAAGEESTRLSLDEI